MIHRTESPDRAMGWLWEQAGNDVEVVGKPVSVTMGRWLFSDPTAASKWLNEQAPGPLKDIALRRLMQYLDQDHESEVRAAWIRQFSDPELAKRYSERK